jgi:hypothetical protein
MTTVHAIECPTCGDLVFSRARHDMRDCSCGEVAVDGGFDYQKVSFRGSCPKTFSLEVDASKAELNLDWNNYGNKFGLIPKNKRISSCERLVTLKTNSKNTTV